MTVFDPSALGRLVDHSSGRVFTLEFARTFQRLLGGRIARLLDGFASGHPAGLDDPDDLMDAVLSLRVSCSMVGAHELAEIARDVERRLRAGDLPGARARATVMPFAAEALDEALDRFLERAHSAA